MYPIIYKILKDNGKLDRAIIVNEPGEYEEYIAGETLYHEQSSELESNPKKHVYDTVSRAEEYLKPALLLDAKLYINLEASPAEIDKVVESIKRQFKATITPKRDRKKRR